MPANSVRDHRGVRRVGLEAPTHCDLALCIEPDRHGPAQDCRRVELAVLEDVPDVLADGPRGLAEELVSWRWLSQTVSLSRRTSSFVRSSSLR
jgi:hypothetical protein